MGTAMKEGNVNNKRESYGDRLRPYESREKFYRLIINVAGNLQTREIFCRNRIQSVAGNV
jgi:hypothetical protein